MRAMRWFLCFVGVGVASTALLVVGDERAFTIIGAAILVATSVFALVSLAAWAFRRVRRETPEPPIGGVVLAQEWKLFRRAIDGLVSGRRTPRPPTG